MRIFTHLLAHDEDIIVLLELRLADLPFQFLVREFHINIIARIMYLLSHFAGILLMNGCDGDDYHLAGR